MRAIWIVSHSFVVLFSKKFPTVESRCRAARQKKYEPLPDEEDVANAFSKGLDLYLRNGSSAVPVLFPRDHVLSPLVFCTCSDVGYVLGVPHVKSVVSDSVLDQVEVVSALDALSQLSQHLEDTLRSGLVSHMGPLFWASFSTVISLAMPMGTLVRPLQAAEMTAASGLQRRDGDDRNVNTNVMMQPSTPSSSTPSSNVERGHSGGLVNAVSSNAVSSSSSSSSSSLSAADSSASGSFHTPSWRISECAVVTAKKSRVAICVEETLESHQYDGAHGATDASRLWGRVKLTADIPTMAPEISLKVRILSNAAPQCDGYRDWMGSVGMSSSSICSDASVASFTCVQNAPIMGSWKTPNNNNSNSNNGQIDRLCHISVCPPVRTEQVLMRFEASPPAALPFRGFYQMKPVSPLEAKVLLQLKLNDRVCNNFEYLQATMSFTGMGGGSIDAFEVSPTEGTVKRSQEPLTLVWDLGTTVMGRKLECALPMTIRFTEPLVFSSVSSAPACFADLVFKMIDFTAAGVKVDGDDVHIYPKASSVIPVTVTNILQSGTYRIWNSLGSYVHACPKPPV